MVTEDPKKHPDEQPSDPLLSEGSFGDRLGIGPEPSAPTRAPNASFSVITDVTGGTGTADDLDDPT